MATVMVIGETGFAGRHFRSAATDAGHRVVGTSRRPGETDLVCDVLDPRSIERALEAASPDAVLNLAGAASVAASFRDPAATFEVNAIGTLNLLEAAARVAPSAHVVSVSSGEVYGRVPESELPVTEQCSPRPVSPYGTSKGSMELICDQYRRTTELDVAIVRAFNHTGPGQSDAFAASTFARQVAEAERDGQDVVTLRTGNLDVERDFSDVRDVVGAYRAIVDSGLTGTFNACSGRPTPLRQIVDLLEAETPLPIEREVDRDRLRPGEPAVLYGSAQRLQEATGWRPEIPLRKTVADLLGWWRERAVA
jgi:GDP-4-dehydro-6-deoxy-D-mannose reductase